MNDRHAWNHSICEECWLEREGTSTPVRIKDEYRDDESCCWCLKQHRSGIYRRENPDDMPCGGYDFEVPVPPHWSTGEIDDDK